MNKINKPERRCCVQRKKLLIAHAGLTEALKEILIYASRDNHSNTDIYEKAQAALDKFQNIQNN